MWQPPQFENSRSNVNRTILTYLGTMFTLGQHTGRNVQAGKTTGPHSSGWESTQSSSWLAGWQVFAVRTAVTSPIGSAAQRVTSHAKKGWL